jgi:hypothetical protein
MSLCAVGIAIWSWNADQERLRAAEQLQQIVEKWNRAVDQFEKFQTKFHEPTSEVELLVRLMRQNPQHWLWQEFEYAPIFTGDKIVARFAPHLSWPQRSIQLGDESVHVLVSQHPCNSRKLIVHTDAASRILDVKVVPGIHMIEPMELTVRSLEPQPVVRVACWERYNSNDLPIVKDLAFTKSSAKNIDPLSIKLIDRQKDHLNAASQASNP